MVKKPISIFDNLKCVMRLEFIRDHLLGTMRQNLFFDGHRSHFITARCPCFLCDLKSTPPFSFAHTHAHTRTAWPQGYPILDSEMTLCACASAVSRHVQMM